MRVKVYSFFHKQKLPPIVMRLAIYRWTFLLFNNKTHIIFTIVHIVIRINRINTMVHDS